MTVGEKIRLERKEKSMTQKKLAESAGVAEISIRQYESNKREPKIAQLEKIAEALNVPVSSFLSPELSKSMTDTIASVFEYTFSLKPDIDKLNRLIRLIQPKDLPIMTKFTNCILSMSPDDKFYIALDTLLDAIQEQNEQ